ncbi:hypothetical protein [Mesonia aquimarina]|uniref:hypothetical protein n=1 Tax=Mesonia aquimarina TaxID=1504967 RepID=UPI000EF5B68B|nr:hypothetical protein [Mesonia aquimarina]
MKNYLEKISNKTLRIFPFLLLFLFFSIKSLGSFAQFQTMLISCVMAVLAIASFYLLMKRDWKGGNKKLVKQKLIRLIIFLTISTVVFLYYIL